MREHKRTTEIRNRCLKVAYYIKDTGMTIREVASVFHMSKSTVYMDMMFRLKEFNPILYNDIQEILQKNKQERHLRGGETTKTRYSKNNKQKRKEEC